MISQGELPLAIVHMGVGGTMKMLAERSDTVLFYWWEPDSMIGFGSDMIRLNFDTKHSCIPNKTYAKFPSYHSCDFALGGLHKAYSAQVI